MNIKNPYNIIFTVLILAVSFNNAPIYGQSPEDDSSPAESATTESYEEKKQIFEFKGQFKDLYTHTTTHEYSRTGGQKVLIADLKRLRLSPQINLSDIFLLHVDYDNEIINGSYLKSSEFDNSWRQPDYNSLFHLSREPYYSDDLYYRTRIHRAYAKLMLSDFTVTLGRQQVRFGSGRLWNPLDILNPIGPTSVEGPEEQHGIDALRAEYYPNNKTELGLILDQKRVNDDGTFSGLSLKNSNIVGRAKTTVKETEIAALFGRISHALTGGIDISGIVYDGTLRGSVLYSSPDQGKSYFLASAGYEYTFSTGIYFLLEYFYNQNSLNSNQALKETYLDRLMFGPNEKNFRKLSNQFLTYNRHYAALALGSDITPLFRGELFMIYDFEGHGIFINPGIKYNPFQNIDLFVGIMLAHIAGHTSEESDFASFEKNAFFYASLTWYL